MTFIAEALRHNPELAIFLTLAVGFLVGRLRIGTFRLGNVVGTLLAGVVIGQLDISVDPVVKIVFFDLFLFATGYKVGPQFIRGLGKNALPQVALTVVLCVTSLVTTVAAAKIFHYDCGTAAGLMAGAFTESTVIGTAGETISHLDLPQAEKTRLQNNIPVAYAVSYLVGTGFVVWFLSSLAPRLFKVDLKAESRKLEAQITGGRELGPGEPSAYREWDLRAYRIDDAAWANRTVAEMEKTFAPDRVFVERIHRGGELLDAKPETVLARGDSSRLRLAGGSSPAESRSAWRSRTAPCWTFRSPLWTSSLTNKAVAERTLAEIAARHGRGVALLKLVRGGEEIPFVPSTVINRGDLLTTGRREERRRARGPGAGIHRAALTRPRTSSSSASGSWWAGWSGCCRSTWRASRSP